MTEDQHSDDDPCFLIEPPIYGHTLLQISVGDGVKVKRHLRDAVERLMRAALQTGGGEAAGTPCPDLSSCTPPYQCGGLGRCQPVIKLPCKIHVSCSIEEQ